MFNWEAWPLSWGRGGLVSMWILKPYLPEGYVIMPGANFHESESQVCLSWLHGSTWCCRGSFDSCGNLASLKGRQGLVWVWSEWVPKITGLKVEGKKSTKIYFFRKPIEKTISTLRPKYFVTKPFGILIFFFFFQFSSAPKRGLGGRLSFFINNFYKKGWKIDLYKKK